MSGAILAALGLGTGGAGGGDVVPAAVNWTDVYDIAVGSTNLQTITGISRPISRSASLTGSGGLQTVVNGASHPYAGAFTVAAGNTVAFLIVNTGIMTVTGTVTIANVSGGGTVLDTFNYTVTRGR